jgi:hypothetical protein
MRYEKLEVWAKEGKLSVCKVLYRTYTRFKKYPSNDIIKYRVYVYQAIVDGMEENSFYRIRKPDYEKLLNIGAKELQRK